MLSGTLSMRDILFRRPGQQAEISAARCLPAFDQLQPRARQYAADSQTQSLDFRGKLVRTDGMRQKGFDEFDKDPNIRRSAYRFLHAPDDKGLVTLDIDFDEIDRQPIRQEFVDRDHIELDRALCLTPLPNIGHRRAAEEFRQVMKGSAPGTLADQSVDCDYIRVMRQPVRVQSSLQQVESVRVRLERIEAAVIPHPRGRNRSVESEICADVENHRLGLQKTSE